MAFKMAKSDKIYALSRTKKVKIPPKWSEDFDDDYDKYMDKGAYYNISKKRKNLSGKFRETLQKICFTFLLLNTSYFDEHIAELYYAPIELQEYLKQIQNPFCVWKISRNIELMSTSPERHQNRHIVSLDHQLYHGIIPLDSLCYISREKVKTVFVDTPLNIFQNLEKTK